MKNSLISLALVLFLCPQPALSGGGIGDLLESMEEDFNSTRRHSPSQDCPSSEADEESIPESQTEKSYWDHIMPLFGFFQTMISKRPYQYEF